MQNLSGLFVCDHNNVELASRQAQANSVSFAEIASYDAKVGPLGALEACLTWLLSVGRNLYVDFIPL